MPQNYGGRIVAILCVLFVALFGIPGLGNGIFNLQTVFSPKVPFGQKLELKPGIDIAGGTSLIYEIKLPPGSTTVDLKRLTEDVTTSLKKRVDPLGVLNLVWRPQVGRIEIQIPRSGQSGEKEAAQKAYSAATDALAKTNLSAADVQRAIETSSGDERDKKLAQLAGGSTKRLEEFKKLAAAFDAKEAEKKAYEAAVKAGDKKAQSEHADKQATAEIEYDNQTKSLDVDTLSPQTLELVLSNDNVAERDQKLADLRAKYAAFPPRVAAIDQFAAAYANFQNYKNTIDDASGLKRMLQGSGVLEFHILVNDTNSSEAAAMLQRLHERGPAPQAGDHMRWYRVDRKDELKGSSVEYNGKSYALAWTWPVVGEPGTSEPPRAMIHRREANPWALVDSTQENDPNGGIAVGFQFDAQGAALFSKLSSENAPPKVTPGNFLAIVLDEKIISAPRLNSEISNKGQITGGGPGGFSTQDAHYLINTLKAGSLPAQLAEEPISERTISATAGTDNLRAALFACAVGLVVVGIFLIAYYYLSGMVAVIAVLMNLIVILGVLALFGATFTLPSIAGIVLTVGTAIDANVLIFERLREEQHRGLSLKMALRNAYDRAFSAIVDSNMTTAITSVFLYWFGSEEVKGFGLTLLIGILSSMFTALFVTKTIFGLLIDSGRVKSLGSLPQTFPKWDRLLKPNIDWMRLVWPFVAFSACLLVGGLSAFVVKEGEMWDIEFASGTSVQFDLKHDVPIDHVRKQLAHESLAIPSPVVVALEGSQSKYEVVTPNDKAKDVREAVVRALGPDLQVQLPSKFDQAAIPIVPIEEALNKSVLPIESESTKIDGQTLDTHDFAGGVAVVLRNIDPPISPNEIKVRYDRAALQPGADVTLTRLRTEVRRLDNDASPNANDKPVSAAAILVFNQDFRYGPQTAGDWQKSLAEPVWKAANEGINREAQLRNVTAFDPQVAGAVKVDASMATGLSLIVIMIYIWFRFGNFKYGTATVLALLHDALITVGVIGLTHYVGGTALGRVLLIEPFRINLTLVAAVLTVMGYSMIDTIVVFDRIREIRGKYGHVTRKVVNDAINQTLSRTLLTVSTTLSMLLLMYICGGEGIHGFTFVLLIGILVGSYSSIAIASPILLIGKDHYRGERDEPAAGRKREFAPAVPGRLVAPAGQVVRRSPNV